jgi:hypothetical protein
MTAIAEAPASPSSSSGGVWPSTVRFRTPADQALAPLRSCL